MKPTYDIFRHLLLLTLVIIGGLTSCRQIETITTQRTVRVDSVNVPVMTPEHKALSQFAVGDSLLFEDDKLRLRIVPIYAAPLSQDVRTYDTPVSLNDSANVGGVSQTPIGYQVEAMIKPDTVIVKVPQKTITETVETLRYKKQMPGWGWMLLGGLAMLSLILITVFKISSK